jgi:hypothetical protein
MRRTNATLAASAIGRHSPRREQGEKEGRRLIFLPEISAPSLLPSLFPLLERAR